MKNPTLLIITFLLFIWAAQAQTKDHQTLLELDLGWEKALLASDVGFLDNLLAEEFIWVHNHASLIDGKNEVVSKARKFQEGQADNTRSRISKDQKVVILGNTGVVSGYTVVERGPGAVTYHFMRTYSKVKGTFLLLSNHTMAIPEEELKE
jgi:hypothetical protein